MISKFELAKGLCKAGKFQLPYFIDEIIPPPANWSGRGPKSKKITAKDALVCQKNLNEVAMKDIAKRKVIIKKKLKDYDPKWLELVTKIIDEKVASIKDSTTIEATYEAGIRTMIRRLEYVQLYISHYIYETLVIKGSEALVKQCRLEYLREEQEAERILQEAKKKNRDDYFEGLVPNPTFTKASPIKKRRVDDGSGVAVSSSSVAVSSSSVAVSSSSSRKKPLPSTPMNCTICMEERSVTNFSLLPCNHKFCRTCCGKFLANEDASKAICPTCRAIITGFEDNEVNEESKCDVDDCDNFLSNEEGYFYAQCIPCLHRVCLSCHDHANKKERANYCKACGETVSEFALYGERSSDNELLE